MHKEKLISNYQIFFELRDLYPKFIDLIAEIMKYAFHHQDTFYQSTYLDGTFNEDDVIFIFSKLNLPLRVVSVINTAPRNTPYTIVNLDFNNAGINSTNEEKP